MKNTKKALLGLSLFYLVLYIPTALMAYLPLWYRFNFQFHRRWNFIGLNEAKRCIDQLTDFFLHIGKLGVGWTEKERLHLLEVRELLDTLTMIAVVSILFLIITYSRSALPVCTLVNGLIILLLSAIIPFFKSFWLDVFHPLFFDNDFWRNTPLDRSFFIMPGIFFRNSAVFLILVSLSLTGIIRFFFSPPPNRKPDKT